MKKVLKIIKWIPIINYVSFFLFAIPIQFIYGFNRKKYIITFLLIIFISIVYVLILKLYLYFINSYYSIYWWLVTYLLGIVISILVEKYIE